MYNAFIRRRVLSQSSTFELYGTPVFSSDVKMIVFGKKRLTANYMLCATHFFI